jgi:hypothetical protein
VPAAHASTPSFEFVSPVPGSTLVLPETNIIIRPGGIVDASSIFGGALFQVSGSSSGSHEGRIRLSDDGQTLTFQPDRPFSYGEEVTCVAGSGLSTDTRGLVLPGRFTFTIAGPEREGLGNFPAPSEDGDSAPFGTLSGSPGAPGRMPRAGAMAESLPPDFPAIQASVYGTPAPGRLFVTDLHFNIFGIRYPSYLLILENNGNPYFYRQLTWTAHDFKMQPNGKLTYFDGDAQAFYELNAHYDVVDSFRCGNGYTTDSHDLVLLPNGHALLMAYDTQIIDMSLIAPGGRFGARVIGLILQELDQQKNVVFQWRSWDHFQITDMWDQNLLARPVVDYAHGNSIDADPQGNLIISSRHMSEVTKISRSTGEILWRMGGRKNQFTFVNEPISFSYQHDAKLLPNGHLTLFDNGNYHVPQFSRAVEYAIDETERTATLVWQYRLQPDVFGRLVGSVQRLPNGNTLICWGATSPSATEVAPDGSIVWDLRFDENITTYRAYRFEWPPVRPAVIALNPSSLTLGMRGGYVTTQIKPADSTFVATEIDPLTVRLNGTLPDTASVKFGDSKKDSLKLSVPDLTMKFPRDPLEPYLQVGINRLVVTGSLNTGELFRGIGEIRVYPPLRVRPAPSGSLRLESTPGVLPVSLAAPARARTLATYDVQGRLVKRWQISPQSAGRATWDGRASSGRAVGSGVYLIRVEDGAPGPALKVVIAR